MRKLNGQFVIVTALVASLLFIYFVFYAEDKSGQEFEEAFLKEEAQTQKVNEWAKRVVEENKSRKPDEAKNTATQRFLELLAPLSVKDIEFHGLVVDQDDEPVGGVIIEYTGSRSLLASGSGPAQIITDQDGRFVIRDAKGESLQIMRMSKYGYQFPDLDRFFMPRGGPKLERYWSDFDEGNPFRIKSWNVDHLSKVVQGRGVTLRVEKVDQDIYVRFDEDQITKVGSDKEAHIIVSLVRRGSSWKIDMKSKAGGYQRTDNYFLYDAPESGYNSKITIQGEKGGWFKEKLYFKSIDGALFGAFRLDIQPSLRHGGVNLIFNYVLNIGGGKDLVINKKSHDDLL